MRAPYVCACMRVRACAHGSHSKEKWGENDETGPLSNAFRREYHERQGDFKKSLTLPAISARCAIERPSARGGKRKNEGESSAKGRKKAPAVKFAADWEAAKAEQRSRAS